MKTIQYLVAGIFMSAFFISCSVNRTPVTGFNYNEPSAGGFASQKATNKSNLEPEQKRTIIYDARMDMTVKNTDSANAALKKCAEKYEGYAQKLSSTYSIIRVKSEKLNQALNDISLLGKVNSKNISGDDVTEEYKDLKIRLENAEKVRTRYLELLAKAQNVNETIAVERELERLNNEIDHLKGKINSISHLSAFCTITVDLQQKVKPGVVGYVFVGLYKGVKWLFVRN